MSDDKYPLIRDIFKCMIYTGCRVTEFFNIRVSDVYLTETRREIILRSEITKTKFARRIPIHREIANIIKGNIEKSKTGYLFEDMSGNKFTYANFRDSYWDKWMYIHGMYNEEVRHLPHDTRYTFSTFCTHSGCNSKYVEAILGHNIKGSIEQLYKDMDRTDPYALYKEIQKLKFEVPKQEIESLDSFLKK